MKTKFRITYVLSIVIIALASIATIGGLFINDLYLESANIKTAWQGNDLVTLVVVLPLLFAAIVLAKRGSERWYLVWMGLLAYMVYNYAFYFFGITFNNFFLLYVAIFSLSIIELILGLSSVRISSISKNFRDNTPVKWISIFLLLIAAPLAFVEVGMCVNYIITGKVPDPPSLIFALDLSIVVPATIIAAILLWKHKKWGYILASIMLVKAFIYGIVLSVGTTLIAFNPAGSWDPLMPFYVFVTVGGFICAYILLSNLRHI